MGSLPPCRRFGQIGGGGRESTETARVSPARERVAAGSGAGGGGPRRPACALVGRPAPPAIVEWPRGEERASWRARSGRAMGGPLHHVRVSRSTPATILGVKPGRQAWKRSARPNRRKCAGGKHHPGPTAATSGRSGSWRASYEVLETRRGVAGPAPAQEVLGGTPASPRPAPAPFRNMPNRSGLGPARPARTPGSSPPRNGGRRDPLAPLRARRPGDLVLHLGRRSGT